MEFLETPLLDDDILKLFVRLAINSIFLTITVRWAIRPANRDRDFTFTAVMMNVTVFFICFTLKKLELGLGMALGLFAIFGVLRYRTDAIRAKEMTYLFIVIGLAVINSLSNKKTSYAELFAVNAAIFTAAVMMERAARSWGDGGSAVNGQATSPLPTGATGDNGSADSDNRNGKSKKQKKYTIEFDSVDGLAPNNRTSLIETLRQRTGLPVADIQVKTIDLRSNTTTLQVTLADEPPLTPELEETAIAAQTDRN